MSDVKEVVIKLPKEVYERFGHEYREKDLISPYVAEAILNAFIKGTVLPEGRGDLRAKLNDAIDNAQTFLSAIEADKRESARNANKEDIIKGLESVKEECGKHLDEGFAWICEPIDKAIKALKEMEVTRTIEADKEDEVRESLEEPEEDDIERE